MHETKIDLSSIDLIEQLFKTTLFVKGAASQSYKRNNYEVTFEQFEILFVLYREDGISQRDIAKMVFKDRSNITRILTILENKGFIIRKIDLNNKRVVKKVYITETGKAQIEKIQPMLEEFNYKSFNGVSEEQMKNLKLTLKMIRENLKDDYTLQI